MPWTSVTAVTRRVPSRSRLSCTITSTAEESCSRIARSGRSMPAISTSVSSRAIASRGELACTVDNEPSWPVFIACSMSRHSPPRTSPTTMRSGRIRSELRTRSRIEISPLPSMLRGPALQPDDVILLQLQLDGVLDRDDALAVGDERRQHVQQRRLAGAGAAGHDDVEPRLDAGVRAVRPSPGSGCRTPMRSGTLNGSAANFRIVSEEPLNASGGIDSVDAGAVGQPGVDQRRGLVDPAADARDDALDHATQMLLRGEPGGAARRACRPSPRRPCPGR